jgi:hypothetical protein
VVPKFLTLNFVLLQPGLLVNEETLLSVFEQFGIISDVSVKSCAMNPNNGLHDGYGFVHFPCSPEGVSVALKAVSALSENPIVDNVHYSCEMSKNLLKLLQVQSQKRSQDAYAALNSHLQYSTRYNSHNFQNYALPGQGYMPGSQNSYYRNLRRPMDPSLPLDPSRLFPGAAAPPLDYSAYAYQQPPAQTRKPSYDPLSLMSPHLRPEQAQEEYPSSWAEPPQQLSGSAPAPAPLGYESSFPGSNLRLQDPYYGLNAPNAPSASRFPEPQLRYSDPRYVSDVRLMEHRHRGPPAASMAPPAAPPGIGSGIGSLARRPADPREVRPPAVPAPISASSGLGYNYSQPLGSMSQPLSQTAYKHEHGYTIEDFVDYPYPQEEPDTRLLESANGEDSSKSVDELNELLSRHSISSTTSTRIY